MPKGQYHRGVQNPRIITRERVEKAWQDYYHKVDYLQYQFLNGEITEAQMHSRTKKAGDKAETLEKQFNLQ